MGQDIWIDLEDIIANQLKLQVELSLSRHYQFMLKHGLAQCEQVADIGTGNGLFLSKVARRHPKINFHGVDNKAHMIEEAKLGREKNVNWIQADALDDNAQEVLKTIDGVLMRYFILHMPNTGTTLPQILRVVRPGTHLWIFDLDTDYCICEPEQDEYKSFQTLITTFCDKNSVEIKTSSMLPPILESTGFEIVEVSIEPFNNQEIDSKLFAEYILREATLYNYSIEGTLNSKRLDEIEHFLFDVMDRDTHFVQYGMTMISAIKKSF